MTFKEYIEENNAIDDIQLALDVAGFEPTFGTVADIANVVISGLRAALNGESDQRKRHLINMGISAASVLPAADVLKAVKYRDAVDSAGGLTSKANTVYNMGTDKRRSRSMIEMD